VIKDAINKYNIEQFFFNRYFIQNAENRFAITQLEFMLWKRGQFIIPQKKVVMLEHFTMEEIENFYVKNEINIPQLQFAITTRCSLKCRDCNALIPEFGRNGQKHIDLSFNDFKQDFDLLMSAVGSIRRFMLLGGEPLLNKELPDMISYIVKHDRIKTIEIITNGTLLPSKQLLDVVGDHSDRVYFHLSNYSQNQSIKHMLKYDKIIKMLNDCGIKHQMSMNLVWNKEESLKYRNYSSIELQAMFENCWLKRCVQIFNGKLSVCPRLSFGLALGFIEAPEDEFIELRNISVDSFLYKLIHFYKKNNFRSCRFCVRINEEIPPAIQI
jgi:hypothetical protein